MLIVTAYKFQHVLHPYLGIVGFFKANLYLLFRNVFPKTIGTEQYLHVPAQRYGLLHFRLRLFPRRAQHAQQPAAVLVKTNVPLLHLPYGGKHLGNAVVKRAPL